MTLFGRPIRMSLVASVGLLTMVLTGTRSEIASASPTHLKKQDLKQQVEALEEQWRVAQLANDVAAMDRLLSDDYVGISMTGQVNTKAQQLDRVRDHKLQMTKIELSDMKVKLIGTIAIVTSRAEIEGMNESINVKGTYRYTRVYQRLPTGGWKITSFEATRVPNHSHESQAGGEPKVGSAQPEPVSNTNREPK